MSTFSRLAVCCALFSCALAHLDINYPVSSWTHSEEQQEEGGVCGGGTRSQAVTWGTENAFLSLSGDEGHTVRVLMASSNSSNADTDIAGSSSFPLTLAQNTTFPSSGNLCLPLTLPADYIVGKVLLVPADTSATVVVEHDAPIVNPATGGNYTYYDYYCSNSTIPALESCSCHCHGDHEHCDESCSAERVQAAAEECAAAAGGSADASASGTSAKGSIGGTQESGDSSGAGVLSLSGGAVILAAVGAVIMA
ncbi:hypothetical protein JCM11641_006205 [Rhodosporidiobolus odoratus]